MKKVFISGRGLISPLGIGLKENEAALRAGKSGIKFIQEWADYDLESQVGGVVPEFTPHPILTRKLMRFCPPTAIMSVSAVAEAFEEAKIPLNEIPQHRIAIVGGVPNGYLSDVLAAVKAYGDDHRLRAVSPCTVPKVMPSSAVSNISLLFGIKGESYDISAACSSSAISIIVGTRLIQTGLYDMVIAGGAEALDWVQVLGFTAMRALSHSYTSTPEKASRPFDRDRDGFVMAAGAGYVLLESEESVKRRGITPIVEVSGIASNSNATDMVVPDADASEAVMREAIADAGLTPGDITYINTHGTATPVGDPVEGEAVRRVFGDKIMVNSTKSMTGHMIGATGAIEVIFTTLMQEKSFISKSLNVDNLDPACDGVDIVRELRENVAIPHALSNSFAFGGSNACLVLSNCR